MVEKGFIVTVILLVGLSVLASIFGSSVTGQQIAPIGSSCKLLATSFSGQQVVVDIGPYIGKFVTFATIESQIDQAGIINFANFYSRPDFRLHDWKAITTSDDPFQDPSPIIVWGLQGNGRPEVIIADYRVKLFDESGGNSLLFSTGSGAYAELYVCT